MKFGLEWRVFIEHTSLVLCSIRFAFLLCIECIQCEGCFLRFASNFCSSACSSARSPTCPPTCDARLIELLIQLFNTFICQVHHAFAQWPAFNLGESLWRYIRSVMSSECTVHCVTLAIRAKRTAFNAEWQCIQCTGQVSSRSNAISSRPVVNFFCKSKFVFFLNGSERAFR